MRKRESTKDLLEREKAIDPEKLIADDFPKAADIMMWTSFERKMRILILNMMNPMIDLASEDRVGLRKEQETTVELEKRIDYLEEIVLYKKKRMVASTYPSNPLDERVEFPKPNKPNSFTSQSIVTIMDEETERVSVFDEILFNVKQQE